MKTRIFAGGASALALALLAMPAIGQESVGRGAPVQPLTYPAERWACPPGTPPANQATCEFVLTVPVSTSNNLSPRDVENGATIETHGGQGPEGGAPPPGQVTLERDIYSSDDYYVDLAAGLWEDPAYFRCNAVAPLAYSWGVNPGSDRLDVNDAYGTARWGDCNVDYPREAIVSPYDFKTAQDHYEALKAETEAKGTRANYSYENPPPDWSGAYVRQGNTAELPQWTLGNTVQTATMTSLMTEEYRTRWAQEIYHAAHSGVIFWPSQFCWPDGFMRRFQGPSVNTHTLIMSHDAMMVMTGVAANFLQQVFFDREFDTTGAVPRLGADVPRWYGETIGFWDDDTLITWTSNIQGWFTHDWWEHSNQLQTIEIYDPVYNDAGEHVGLMHETIFYDPEALVEPVRLVRKFNRQSTLATALPHTYIECVQTIYPVPTGEGNRVQAVPLTPGAKFEYEVPDMFGRPWAHYFSAYEEGMQRPDQASGLFGF